MLCASSAEVWGDSGNSGLSLFEDFGIYRQLPLQVRTEAWVCSVRAQRKFIATGTHAMIGSDGGYVPVLRSCAWNVFLDRTPASFLSDGARLFTTRIA